MITSGYPWSSARKTEIVDLANGVACSDLAEFPVEIHGAVGVNFDGIPVVCGGRTHEGPNTYSQKCYRFTNGVWEEITSMKEKRGFAVGVMYNEKLHVFGGYGASRSQTSETINLDGEVTDGTDLPTAVSIHAMTSINDTVSLISGGRTNFIYNSAQTWYYNHDTEAFSSGPDLLEGRNSHGSAIIVDKVTKAKIVVVAGGLNGANVFMDSTEMLINGQWETGTIQYRKKKVFICFSDIFV